MNYFDELKKAMEWLATKPEVRFIGQAVGYPGTAMFNTLKDIDPAKRIELPVAEEMQMGMATGLALAGYFPVSVYPRWNFLLCAISGLVNHVDKYSLISDYKTRMIIRTGIGSVCPLDPQWQHKGDFTESIREMCKTVEVIRLEKPEDIMPAYECAYYSPYSTLLCEVSDFLNEDFRQEYVKFKESYGGK